MQPIKPNSNKRWLLTLTVIVLLGAGIRLYLINQSGYKIDYDEAMIGLNTRHLLYEGAWNAFVPGQATLGNIEAYLLAPFFLLIGPSVYAFRIYSILINCAFIISTAYLGKEIGNHRVGILAATFAAVAPAYMQVTGLKTWGATIEIMVLGNLLFIAISKLCQKATGPKNLWATTIGLSAGLMFWNSWLSFYFFLPILPIFLWKRQLIRWLPIILLSFIIGSLPLWIHNINNNFESFQTVLNQTDERGVSRIDTTIKLITEQYPTLLAGFSAWSKTESLIGLLTTISYSAGIVILAYHSYKTKNVSAILCLGLLLSIIVIYVQSGYGRSTFNNYGVDSTGRYLLMAHCVFPIGVALLAEYINRKPLLSKAFITTLVIANLTTISTINTMWAFDSPYYNRQPDNIEDIANYLIEHNYQYVWTDVGIAQPLMFLSEEKIIAADYADYSYGGILRFPEAFSQVLQAENPVYLVAIIPDQADTPLSRELDREGINYETVNFGTARLYIPDEAILPERVILGLGLQY